MERKRFCATMLAAALAASQGCSSEPAAGGPDARAAGADAAAQPGLDAASSLDAAAPSADAASSADAGAPDPTALPDVETATWEGALANGKNVVVTYPKTWPGLLPVVVLAHGFQLGKGDYADTADHLARYGYIVASADYPNSLFSFDHHDVVLALQAAIDLLTTQPPAALAGRVDATRIAAMGHSIGGKGAIWTGIEEPRVKAVVALDPVDDDQSPTGQDPVKHPSIAPELMAGLTVPILYFAGEVSGSCAPAASNACRFEEASTVASAHYLQVLEDFGHMQFTDPTFCLICATCTAGVSGDAYDRAKASMRGVVVAFLEETLRGDARWHGWLAGAERDALAAQGVILDAAAQATFCTPP